MPPDLIWACRSGGCAILSEGGVTVVGMATIEDRLGTLEVRVNNLETWAGPGQAGALAEGQRQIRSDITVMRRDIAKIQGDMAKMRAEFTFEFTTLKTDVATLKTDVATLKTDMAEVKETVREILRRLPAPPAEA